MKLLKIISGGQTGADMGGLLAAKELGIETGGTAASRYLTEKGSNYELFNEYGLTCFGSYHERTWENVKDSEATIIFGHTSSPGSKLTIRCCTTQGKPLLINPNEKELAEFLQEHQVKILNIAGNRESKSPGIEQSVKEFLVEALS